MREGFLSHVARCERSIATCQMRETFLMWTIVEPIYICRVSAGRVSVCRALKALQMREMKSEGFPRFLWLQIHMGWLRLVGSLKLQVSFAKEPYKRACILQMREMKSERFAQHVWLQIHTRGCHRKRDLQHVKRAQHWWHKHVPALVAPRLYNGERTVTESSTLQHAATRTHTHTHTHTCTQSERFARLMWLQIHMGWLRLVGSLKLQVSFAKEPYKRACILQMREMKSERFARLMWLQIHMGWLWLAGSLKSKVSFAKEPYKRGVILQKIPIILISLLLEATPYTQIFNKSDSVCCSVLQCVAVCLRLINSLIVSSHLFHITMASSSRLIKIIGIFCRMTSNH